LTSEAPCSPSTDLTGWLGLFSLLVLLLPMPATQKIKHLFFSPRPLHLYKQVDIFI
jgi:hypothetical protein